MTRLVYREPPPPLIDGPAAPDPRRGVRMPLRTRWMIVRLRQGPSWRTLWADLRRDLRYLVRG